MTTVAQKKREMVYASQLAHTLESSWSIEFPEDEREWPDLIIQDGNERFGLEIREITKDKETKTGSKRRAIESRNIQIVRGLADNYYQLTSIPMKVEMLGNIDNEAEILESLLQFSLESKEWDNRRIDTKNNSILYATHLPEKMGSYKRWEYVNDMVGWVREIDSEFLVPFVSEKEKKIPKYKIHLNDIRLLLVADPTYCSGQLSFTDQKIDIESEFSEIYFLVYPNEVHLTNS